MRIPSTQHFFLVDLVELDRWVYPHPCWHSTFHTLQGWWYKYVPLETSNFVAIWYVISRCCNASYSKTPDHFLANLICAVLATCSCALFSGFVHAFCLRAVLVTCSCALFSGFVCAICLHAVSATCSCALASGFVCAICLRSISATCSCVLFSRFVRAFCLCSVLVTILFSVCRILTTSYMIFSIPFPPIMYWHYTESNVHYNFITWCSRISYCYVEVDRYGR